MGSEILLCLYAEELKYTSGIGGFERLFERLFCMALSRFVKSETEGSLALP